jgi:hypothetical protein
LPDASKAISEAESMRFTLSGFWGYPNSTGPKGSLCGKAKRPTDTISIRPVLYALRLAQLVQ